MPKQIEVEQAVAKIYNAMLDNIALSQHRLYIHDATTYGTGAMKFTQTPCGCPACKRVRLQKEEPKRYGAWLDALVIGATILAGVAVALVLKRWLG